MDFRKKLDSRLTPENIHELTFLTQGKRNDRRKEQLYTLITDPDNRIAYNALWVFTHFDLADNEWLYAQRDNLTDILLKETHTGKKRLLLTLLERQPVDKESVRTDYLDFCLSKILGTEPYGIRALCMKQAFAQCRHFPELLDELVSIMDMLDGCELSPGLRTARKNILKQLRQGEKAAR